jgi:hypothetical protein
VEDIASESSIICVTESHLDTNIVDNDIIIDGFSDQILRKDRNCIAITCYLNRLKFEINLTKLRKSKMPKR